MAGSMNKVILVGRIGQDVKLSYTTSGQAFANLSVATDESYKDRNTGQRVEKAEWHRVVCWRHTAEFAGKYLGKGRLVLVEGKLTTRKWQDQNGQDRYTTEILANSIQALDKAPEGQSQNGGYQQQNQQQGGYQGQQQNQSQWDDNEDLGPAFPSESSGLDEVPF